MFIQRLGYSDIFKDKKPGSLISYLYKIDVDFLESIVAFYSVNNTYSEADIDGGRTLTDYIEVELGYSNSVILNRTAILNLYNIYLENKDEIDQNKTGEDKRELIQPVLLINDILNKKQENYSNEVSPSNEIDSLFDFVFYSKFENAEFDSYKDDRVDIFKLATCVLYRFNKLSEFLESYTNYRDELFDYFNVSNALEFKKYAFNIIFTCLINKVETKSPKIKFDNALFFENFLKKLALIDTTDDGIFTDFTNLKEKPLLMKADSEYIVIDYYFLFEKFNKGIKFILKDIYNRVNNLDSKSGAFFNFYNKEFIEKHLTRGLLDEIFNKNHFIKITNYDVEGCPDYYLRIGNSIFIFEIKDVLIKADNKTSYNNEELDKEIIKKLVEKAGIGQLINHLDKISKNEFKYIDYDFLNKEKSCKIYPILVLNDRIFDTIGFNYKINSYFLKELLGKNLTHLKVNDLVVFDLNTLIYFKDYLTECDGNLENLLDEHIKFMMSEIIVTKNSKEEREEENYSQLFDKLKPISERLSHNKLSYNAESFTREFSVIFEKED